MSKELAVGLSFMSNSEIAEVLSHLIKESTDERRTFLNNLWTRKAKVLAKKKRREQTTANAAQIPQNSMLQNPIFPVRQPIMSPYCQKIGAKTLPSKVLLFSNLKRSDQTIPSFLTSK